MENNYFERLNYLETVRREEIKQDIIVARALGGIENNPEYDAARQAQAENEMEIMMLRERDPRAMKQFAVGEYKIDVWAYVDNSDYVMANLNKNFTAEESVALILHSEKVALERKIADLTVLMDELHDELRSEIKAWIAQKQGVLDYLMGLNRSDMVFVEISSHPAGLIPSVSRTLEGAISKTTGTEIMLQYLSDKDEEYTPTLAKITVEDRKIVDVVLMRTRCGAKVCSICDFDEKAPEPSAVSLNEIYDLQVEMQFPYQPGDLVCVEFNGDNYFLVADPELPEVKAQLEEKKETSGQRESWLPIRIPAFFVHTTNHWGGADGQLVSSIDTANRGMNHIYKISQDEIPGYLNGKIKALQNSNV